MRELGNGWQVYAIRFGLDPAIASTLADARAFFHGHDSVISANAWGKGGNARVYLELWSQNRMSIVRDYQPPFFCVDAMDIVANGWLLFEPLRNMPPHWFNGAKTRDSVARLIKDFDDEKESWIERARGIALANKENF